MDIVQAEKSNTIQSNKYSYTFTWLSYKNEMDRSCTIRLNDGGLDDLLFSH